MTVAEHDLCAGETPERIPEENSPQSVVLVLVLVPALVLVLVTIQTIKQYFKILKTSETLGDTLVNKVVTIS